MAQGGVGAYGNYGNSYAMGAGYGAQRGGYASGPPRGGGTYTPRAGSSVSQGLWDIGCSSHFTSLVPGLDSGQESPSGSLVLPLVLQGRYFLAVWTMPPRRTAYWSTANSGERCSSFCSDVWCSHTQVDATLWTLAGPSADSVLPDIWRCSSSLILSR